MKNKFLLIAALFCATITFAQDLKLEQLDASFWGKTNLATPCAGYDTGKTLIRLEYRITNLSDSVAVFPAYTIATNTCRGTQEVNELITISVEDENGNVVHQHNDGIAVKDDALYYYFVTTDGCWNNAAGKTQFATMGQIGLSPGHFHQTNAFPSGMQLGFSPNFLPGADTFKIKSWLNTPYFDRGADCATDTTEKWFFIDPLNKVLSEVAPPSGRIAPPCTNPQMIFELLRIGNEFSWSGAACSEKTITVKILKGNTVKASETYEVKGNVWKHDKAVNRKGLQQLWGGGSGYVIEVTDGQTTLKTEKFNY